jgi:probable phosphoglycerate mutase
VVRVRHFIMHAHHVSPLQRAAAEPQRSATMELHCLRHGITVGNVQGCYQGFCDSALTDEQRAAFSAVGFDASVYDAVYCSPRGRCRDTARALGINSLIDEPRLAERHFGVFEGLPRAECEQRFPAEFAAFQRFDADYQIPQGESRASNLARVLDWLEEAAAYGRVLAITHGGTIDLLYRMATSSPLHGGATIFAASNASVSRFEVCWPKLQLIAYDVPVAKFAGARVVA